MKYLELTELKEALTAKGIEYKEEQWSEGTYFIRVSNGYCNYIRVSMSEGDLGYYVRYSGVIYEDLTLEEVLELAERVVA